MFHLHKPHLSGSIHSGHFMVSRLDDDEEDNNDPADDSSESERDNANSVAIDINNLESALDASNNLDLTYRVESPTTCKNEQLTSWNDLDRPAKHSQNQYLTYYTNTYANNNNNSNQGNEDDIVVAPVDATTTSRRGGLVKGSSTGSDGLVTLQHTSGVGLTRILSPSSNQLSRMSSTGSSSIISGSLQLEPKTSSDHHLHHQHQQHRYNAGAISFAQGDPQGDESNDLYSTSGISTSMDVIHTPSNNMACCDHQQQLEQQQQLMQDNHLSMQRHLQPRQAVTIDTSLTKLFETMSLYYSTSLTSPKWKSFKGLKLRLKNKIRLNNLIWRTWFLQYIRGRRPPGCTFTAPAETDVHKKTETVVLEGKYWKRKEKAIADEYKKWRIFTVQKSQVNYFRPSSFDWDSRAANLASTCSMYGPEYGHFYPDYDMNLAYNLNNLPPMIEEGIEPGDSGQYYSPMLQPSLPQQQHPQQQLSGLLLSSQQPIQQQIPTTSTSTTALAAQHHQHQQSQHATSSNNNGAIQQHQHHLQHQQQHHHQQQRLSSPEQSISAASEQLYAFDGTPVVPHLFSAGGGGIGSRGGTETRRACHINAEQKRRCNIKNGFDTLKSILPSINQNVNVKISKASMLQKAALYISALSTEQKHQADEQAVLKQQIETLKSTIRSYQSQLLASGGPVGCQSSSQARDMLQAYVRRRTLENWKFWIFSLIIEPLFETYYNTVSTTSFAEACKTISHWLDRSCGLVSLRKEALDSLTFLSTSTNILNTPQTLPTEAVDAVRNQQQQQPLQQQQQQQIQSQTQLQHPRPPQHQQQQQQQQQPYNGSTTFYFAS